MSSVRFLSVAVGVALGLATANTVNRIWTGDCVGAPSHQLAIGTDAFYPRPWTGTLYLAAVYDEKLSQEQITANYLAGP